MSTETSTSLLDDALTCIGRRITLILLDPGDKGKNYVASLHNEVLAAVWIIGLLSSNGTPDVPKSVRIAFQSFSDIMDPGTYTTPDVTPLRQPQDIFPSCFTEWWIIGEGEALKEPFDIRNELVVELLRALEKRQAGSKLRANVLEKLKKASEASQEIENFWPDFVNDYLVDVINEKQLLANVINEKLER